MAATALDPNSALVIIDLQKGLANFPTVTPIADVVSNAGRVSRRPSEATIFLWCS